MLAEDTIEPPVLRALFYLPACVLAFTAVKLPVVYYLRLGGAGWMLFRPAAAAAAVKGKK